MSDININETEKVNVYNDDSDLNKFNMLWDVGAHLNKPLHISISYLF